MKEGDNVYDINTTIVVINYAKAAEPDWCSSSSVANFFLSIAVLTVSLHFTLICFLSCRLWRPRFDHWTSDVCIVCSHVVGVVVPVIVSSLAAACATLLHKSSD